MTLAGFVMVLIGAPLGVWVSAQREASTQTPAPTVAAVGSGPLAPDGSASSATSRVAAVLAATGTPAAQEDTATATATPTRASSPRATATATPAARPTATPTEAPTAVPTPTPEPPFDPADDPACTIEAEQAVVGQPMAMACSGFVPDSLVRVYWKGVSNSLASFEASAGGRGEVEVQVPDVAPERWHVRASDGDGRAATAPVTVVGPEMTIDAIVGERESPLTATLTGFDSGEKVALRWYGVDDPDHITLRTPAVAADGSATAELEVPASSASGRHRFVAVGLASGAEIERIFTVVSPGEPVNFFQGTTGCNRIALIFNVGIGNPIDAGSLETLRRENVPATVFVMGWWVERFPESFQQIADGSFVIGNHGHIALNLVALGDADVVADLDTADAAITAALGRPTERWFTPYAGTIDDRVRSLAVSAGYIPVGWRVNTNDWSAETSADQIYTLAVDGAYDGAIVEFHLDGPTTASSTGVALPRIIETLRDRGYTFVTVPELAAPCAAAGDAAASGTPQDQAAVPSSRQAVTRQ